MHDRQTDEGVLTFGNQGALYMFNMTWWDHETGSIWVQLTGRAERGELTGTTLTQLPAYTGPWSTWLEGHPDTLVLDESVGFGFRENPRDGFVIGIALGQDSAAFYFPESAAAGVVNSSVGPTPVLVYADADTREIKTFARLVDGRALTFRLAGEFLIDEQTNSVWSPRNGLALDGELQGQFLTALPYTPAFDWSWRDFYPDATFFPAYRGR